MLPFKIDTLKYLSYRNRMYINSNIFVSPFLKCSKQWYLRMLPES